MLLYAPEGFDQSKARLRTVFSYDISSPKRSSRVRRVLSAWQTGKQYSVFEMCLFVRERYELIADLHEMMHPEEDSLIVWHSAGMQRWTWMHDKFANDTLGGARPLSVEEMDGWGHFIIAYDVCDEDRLHAVHRTVRAGCVALQRSVFWFRGKGSEAIALGERIGTIVTDDDRLWVYPVARAADIWFVVGRRPPLLATGRRAGF